MWCVYGAKNQRGRRKAAPAGRLPSQHNRVSRPNLLFFDFSKIYKTRGDTVREIGNICDSPQHAYLSNTVEFLSRLADVYVSVP